MLKDPGKPAQKQTMGLAVSTLRGQENPEAGHEIAPNTVANATIIIVLATKIQKFVAKLATRFL